MVMMIFKYYNINENLDLFNILNKIIYFSIILKKDCSLKILLMILYQVKFKKY